MIACTQCKPVTRDSSFLLLWKNDFDLLSSLSILWVFTSCTRFIILSRVIHFLIFQRPESLLHLFIKLCKVCFNFSFAIFVRILWRKEIHNYNDSLRASSSFWGRSWKIDAREDTRKRAGRAFVGHSGPSSIICPDRSKGANDATSGTNKLYARQRSCDYHYYQYPRPNRTNVFHEEGCLT